MKNIAYMMFAEIKKRIKEKNVNVEFDESVINKIVKECIETNYGARPLKRKIQKLINDVIAEKILKNEITDGIKRLIKYENDEIKIVEYAVING